jgi:hypothetical protein
VYLGAVIGGNGIEYQFLAALATRHGADAHSALFTNVHCHRDSPYRIDLNIAEYRRKPGRMKNPTLIFDSKEIITT